MPRAPAPAPILFAPAVSTPAGVEVGATGVFVAVVAILVPIAPEADTPPPPPTAVVPEIYVDGEGVLTITVVEVTVLEELGSEAVGRETVDSPGTVVVPGTPGMLTDVAPGTLTEALEGGAGMIVELTLG